MVGEKMLTNAELIDTNWTTSYNTSAAAFVLLRSNAVTPSSWKLNEDGNGRDVPSMDDPVAIAVWCYF